MPTPSLSAPWVAKVTVLGIEPRPQHSKCSVLPLDHTVGKDLAGFEPATYPFAVDHSSWLSYKSHVEAAARSFAAWKRERNLEYINFNKRVAGFETVEARPMQRKFEVVVFEFRVASNFMPTLALTLPL